MGKTNKKAKVTTPDLDFTIELVEPAKLKPHPGNYRIHPQDELAHIIESIKEHGVYKNIVVACDYTILAGHGVTDGCVALKLPKVPVRKMKFGPNDPRALKILTGDNEIGKMAEVNDRLLTEHLRAISMGDESKLVGTGYDASMLSALVMVTRPESEIKDINEASQWVGMPDYENTTEPYKTIVHCEDEKMRWKLHKLIGAKNVRGANGRTCSCWYPDREREDKSSLKFAQKKDA